MYQVLPPVMLLRVDLGGISIRYFPLLATLAPFDDDAPDRLQQRAHEAGCLNDYIALRDECNRRDGQRLLDRLRALHLSVRAADNCLQA